MGQVFGRNGVAEPAYGILKRTNFYEIRKYGVRFAAETPSTGDKAFMKLAKYIGVFGEPENTAKESISMTAPVSMKQQHTEKIAMTAPVVMKQQSDVAAQHTMTFILPEKYKSLESIPKPNNPEISIKEIPAQIGAVHRFSGFMDWDKNRKVANELGDKLRQDGVHLSDDRISNFEYWGYNPPFTLPMFRRNEVFIELSSQEVEALVNGEAKEYN
mgnify:CR=1 FL=1